MNVLLLEMRSTLKKHRPNLGLARISTRLKGEGHTVHYHVATKAIPFPVDFAPEKVYVSLTFSWDIQSTVEILRNMFFWNPGLKESTVIGGVATTANRETIIDELGIIPEMGCCRVLDEGIADREFFEDLDETYVFTSRGCGNNCSFCCVPSIEPEKYSIKSWKEQIDMTKKKVIICDNNLLLAEPEHKRAVLNYLAEIAPREGRKVEGRRAIRVVEFDGGLDFRHLSDPENLALISNIHFSQFRVAFDNIHYEKAFHQAAMNLIPLLGQTRRGVYDKTNVFTMYGCPHTDDTPVDTLYRIYKLRFHYSFLPWLMRYIPLSASEYKKYVAPNWENFQVDLKDMGQYVNNRTMFMKVPEYIQYLGNTKETGKKVVYEGLSLNEAAHKYGLDMFLIVDRMDFTKGFEHNRSLLEEQIYRRNRNQERLQPMDAEQFFLTA